MQFNSSATGQDLVSDTYFWSDTTATSYVINDLTRSINFALDKYTAMIIQADQRWQWDDTNNTDNPIGTADLVQGQALYGLDPTMLTIERVEVQDSAGNWINLENIDRQDIDIAMDEFQSTNGTPQYYDKKARSIQVYPAPSYAMTGGIKIYFSRAFGHFVPTDTTKEPGFAQPFHRLLSMNAAMDYCLKFKQDRVGMLNAKILEMEEEMTEFYAQRNEDRQPTLGPSTFGSGRYFNNSDFTPRI